MLRIVITLILGALVCVEKAHAFSLRSGTCNTSEVPVGSMPGRAVLTGVSSKFTSAMSPVRVIPNREHTIVLTRVSGSGGFRGLLLYVLDSDFNRIGTLAAVGGASVQNLSSCGGPGNTLTHTPSSSFAATQSFTWTAPSAVSGPVTIHAIAYEASTAWNVPTPLVVALADPGPAVIDVNSTADTGDGQLSDGESTDVEITQIIVGLDKEANNPEDSSASDAIANPQNYRLFRAGANNQIDSQTCAAGVSGDDTPIDIDAVVYDNAAKSVTLQLNGTIPLGTEKYRLFLCADTDPDVTLNGIKDTVGNSLDGNSDGTGGDDFTIDFEVRTRRDNQCNFIVIPSELKGGAVVCL